MESERQATSDNPLAYGADAFPLRSDGYLRTGIRNLVAAKRYLRRKFNRGLPEQAVSRPGARFYVTARNIGGDPIWLLGPYGSHTVALLNVARGRGLALAANPNAWFCTFGTASALAVIPTRFGR